MRTRAARRHHPGSGTRRPGGRGGGRGTALSFAAWLAGSIVVIVPLAMDPGGYFIFLPLKWTIVTALVFAALATLILQRRPLPRDAATLAWVGLLAVVIAASALGVGGLTSWIGYPGRYLGALAWLTFFGAFVMGASLTARGDRDVVARAAAVGSTVVSVYALLQEVGVDPIDWDANVDLDRARSTLGNASFLGAYLAMVVPLSARLALDGGASTRVRVVHATAAGLGTCALLASESRGAWLGVLAGALVVLALERRRLCALPRRTVAAIGAGVLVVMALLVTVSPYAARVRSITDTSQTTGHGRIVQWSRTVDLIADRPVLGWGPETYAFRFPAVIDAEFERDVGRAVVPDRAHNLFLDLASTLGLAGVFTYTAVLVLLAIGVARARDPDPLTVALAGACTAYVGQLQFSFSVPYLDGIFWLFAGLLAAASAPRQVGIARAWVVAPALVALAAATWGGMEVAADRTLRAALEAEADGDFPRAQRLIDDAAERAVLRAQYRQGAGRLHGRVAELSGEPAHFERALDAIDEALDLVPDDLELASDRGDLLLAWGEHLLDRDLVDRAARQYTAILERDPNSSRVHLTLGVAYVQLGRTDEAEDEWLTAASLAPDAPNPLLNLGRLYVQQAREDDARRALLAVLEIDPANAVARDLLDGLGT